MSGLNGCLSRRLHRWPAYEPCNLPDSTPNSIQLSPCSFVIARGVACFTHLLGRFQEVELLDVTRVLAQRCRNVLHNLRHSFDNESHQCFACCPSFIVEQRRCMTINMRLP